MRSPRSHPEWHQAMNAFMWELDLPGIHRQSIQHLVGPGLGRIFMKFWVEQDRIDSEIIRDPLDDSDDPRWFRIDGTPERGGSADEVLARKWRERARIFFRAHGMQVLHVADWLIAARRTGAPWLQNVDGRGEPKKLLKSASLQQLVHEANKGLRNHRRDHFRTERIAAELSPDDEAEIVDLGAGHMLVELLTPRALDVEGARMSHCIGHGSYDDRLRDAAFRYLSVRDPQGRPLATLELRGNVVRQFRGRANSDPSIAVVDLLSRHAAESGWQEFEEAGAGRYIRATNRIMLADERLERDGISCDQGDNDDIDAGEERLPLHRQPQPG